MHRLTLIVALCAFPAAAQAPSLDDLLGGYTRAGWFAVDDGGERFVCAPAHGFAVANLLVLKIYERAQGASCS